MTTSDQIIATATSILSQCIVAANEAAMAAAFIADANPAPLNSPAFTGMPTAPTAPQNTNSTQIATTAYLDRLLGAANGIPTLDSTGRIPTAQLPASVLGGLDFLGLWNASTNTPTIVSGTGTSGDFYIVQTAGTTNIDGTSSWAVGDEIVFNGGSINQWQKVSPTYTPVAGITLSSLAAQSANTFVANATGSSASPTAINETTATSMLNAMVGDSGSGGTKGLAPAPSSGDAAAGKFLKADGTYAVPPGAVSPGDLAAYALLDSPAFINTPTAPTLSVDTSSTGLATCAFVLNQAASANPLIDGTAAPGTSTRYARADHVHPTDTTRAPVANPTFTGTPAAPTPGSNINTTQIPTTAWVNTYFLTLAAAASTYAPLVSPAFSSTPTAPTASPGTNTTQLATCQFVETAVAAVPTGQPIPTSSTLAIGTAINCFYLGSVLVDGGTTSGSNLNRIWTWVSDGMGSGALTGAGGACPSGSTWKNISGDSLAGEVGLFVRVS